MGSHPRTRVAVLLVAAFAACSGVTIALPPDAPAAPPPAAPAAPQIAPLDFALWVAAGAVFAGEVALDAAVPAGRAPGVIDGGERISEPAPIPEWGTGGDDPSGPWPAA
jgi:hypothetical protein